MDVQLGPTGQAGPQREMVLKPAAGARNAAEVDSGAANGIATTVDRKGRGSGPSGPESSLFGTPKGAGRAIPMHLGGSTKEEQLLREFRPHRLR